MFRDKSNEIYKMAHSMVSNQEDVATAIEVSVSRELNLIIFVEKRRKFLQQTVAYLNLAIHFTVNLPGRNFHKLSKLEL